MPNSNIQLINQNPILTRPGVVSPISSPAGKKFGTIWSKLGPVSTSPFVKAQQRLGFQPISNNNARTQSSAERRISKETDTFHMDTKHLIYETAKFLEIEREIEERVENARLEISMSKILTARKKLFTQREPTPIMILTAAFLDGECRACEKDPPYYGNWNLRKQMFKSQQDKVLSGKSESYERMRQLNTAVQYGYLGCEPCDTSTPAKLPPNNLVSKTDETVGIPKQTIQQLARLVMNSARWRESTLQNQPNVIRPTAVATQPENKNVDVEFNATFTVPRANAPPSAPEKPRRLMLEQKQGNYNEAMSDGKGLENNLQDQAKFPIGFTTAMLTVDQKATLPKQSNVRFMDDALAELQRMYIERQAVPTVTDDAMSAQNRDMIERYVNELMVKKSIKDKDTDSDNDDEFLDTTASIHPPVVRKDSLTSNGTASTAHSLKSGKVNQCSVS